MPTKGMIMISSFSTKKGAFTASILANLVAMYFGARI